MYIEKLEIEFNIHKLDSLLDKLSEQKRLPKEVTEYAHTMSNEGKQSVILSAFLPQNAKFCNCIYVYECIPEEWMIYLCEREFWETYCEFMYKGTCVTYITDNSNIITRKITKKGLCETIAESASEAKFFDWNGLAVIANDPVCRFITIPTRESYLGLPEDIRSKIQYNAPDVYINIGNNFVRVCNLKGILKIAIELQAQHIRKEDTEPYEEKEN